MIGMRFGWRPRGDAVFSSGARPWPAGLRVRAPEGCHCGAQQDGDAKGGNPEVFGPWCQGRQSLNLTARFRVRPLSGGEMLYGSTAVPMS